MAGKQAKTLSNENIHDLLVYASCTRQPIRNRVIVLLSVKAGMRAGEIAKLSWSMLLNADGAVGGVLELRDAIVKYGTGRLVPIHNELRDALVELRQCSEGLGAVVKSERGSFMRPVSIVRWFAIAYQAVGLDGCSSHSGRRTFVTRAARLVHRAGGSLRDV
ncbi:MAG: tyrosine-type recombinase/integrase, partial [Afipia sp.]|nr:tyrosine-type recombinase/integrase [Afipia sp.]